MEMSKRELQEKYVLYQLLNQNLETLKQQLDLIEQQFIEVKMSLTSIDDVKKSKKENEIFLPLGSGCYGKGKLMDKDNILVDVGAGVFMNKKSSEAKSFLDKRFKEFEKAGTEINQQIERIAKQMNQLGSEIQRLAQKEEKS